MMAQYGIIFTIVVALYFDFVNGFHDAANSIATVVSTRVLSPKLAVLWAAFFNFIAFLVFGTEVANTIAKDVVVQDVLTVGVIFAGLMGAIIWNLITYYLGIPSSSSHALVGGLAGAAIVRGGFDVLVLGGFRKILAFIILSPLIGLIIAFVFFVLVSWFMTIFKSKKAVDRANYSFRKLQLVSAAAYSLGHGGNDAQKTMGIMYALLISGGYLSVTQEVPLWVVLSAHTAIALGTLSGGMKIVKTMGSKITRLQPVGGVCAETAGAVTLFVASAAGIPVSTTHTITGAIIGVGSAKRFNGVRWNLAGKVVWAWVLTIPAAAIVSALFSIVIGAFS
jgi:PiT family inorganic phosphate transporter